ncbi:MAG: 3-keto-disaccharide hydrolase [Candidatus Zipacnadales bacterium]
MSFASAVRLIVTTLSAGGFTFQGTHMIASQQAGDWIELFNGTDLTGWKTDGEHEWRVASAVTLKPQDPKQFAIVNGTGIFVNGETGRTRDIYTECLHSDCELHIEFCVPQGSNSGVYLMGHYEIQVWDSWGVEKPTYADCGGIYCQWIDEHAVGGTPPRINASKPPGEWQSFDVVFRGPRFDAEGHKIANAKFERVEHNGVLIHENVEVGGPTRASMPGPEKPRGPLMLQGDHGPVAYRNVRIRLLD